MFNTTLKFNISVSAGSNAGGSSYAYYRYYYASIQAVGG